MLGSLLLGRNGTISPRRMGLLGNQTKNAEPNSRNYDQFITDKKIPSLGGYFLIPKVLYTEPYVQCTTGYIVGNAPYAPYSQYVRGDTYKSTGVSRGV